MIKESGNVINLARKDILQAGEKIQDEKEKKQKLERKFRDWKATRE